jgi:photosystem II stability/assembly factor-like uncharacterized protein
VWGVSDDDLWAVGGHPDLDGVILHKDAAGWRVVPSPTTTAAYFKVWGAASNDIFICGQGGTILHYDGNGWTAQPTGLDQTVTLFTVAGSSGKDVWTVGGTGVALALHYDGASWTPVNDSVLNDHGGLAGVAVDHDGTALLVGSNGAKLRGRVGALVDETELDRITTDLHAVAFRDGEAFVVGGNYLASCGRMCQGVIGHYGGAAPTTLR